MIVVSKNYCNFGSSTVCTFKYFFHLKLTLQRNLCLFPPQREYERGVQDCDSALCVSEGSRRALFRKALCLREMGRLREAYECGTKCLLTAPCVRYQHHEYSRK